MDIDSIGTKCDPVITYDEMADGKWLSYDKLNPSLASKGSTLAQPCGSIAKY